MATTGPGAVGARPRWRRWLLAALPWLAAALLAVGGLLASRTSAAPAPAAPTPIAAATPAADVTTTALPVTAAAATSPAGDLPPTLELSVLATARATLGTAGLPGAGPAPDRWPLEVRIADLQRLPDGIAVVVVHALVIDHADGAWQQPQPRAVAVPVRLDPPSVLGDAWPLAAPALSTRLPAGSDAGEPDPAVVAALEGAGWTVQEVTDVEHVLGQHLRVSVRGTAPDDDTVTSHTVWLRDDPGGPRPLGTTAHQLETP